MHDDRPALISDSSDQRSTTIRRMQQLLKVRCRVGPSWTKSRTWHQTTSESLEIGQDICTVSKSLSPADISSLRPNLSYVGKSRLENAHRRGIHKFLGQAIIDMDVSINRPEIQSAIVDHFVHKGMQGSIVKAFRVGGHREGNLHIGMTLTQNALVEEKFAVVEKAGQNYRFQKLRNPICLVRVKTNVAFCPASWADSQKPWSGLHSNIQRIPIFGFYIDRLMMPRETYALTGTGHGS